VTIKLNFSILNKNNKNSKNFSDKISPKIKNNPESQAQAQDENKKSQEENYKINLKKNNSFFNDYFYENSIDKSSILPNSNKKEASLLDIPEYRELYKTFSVVLRDENLNELDNIKHDVKENDKYYKYGLIAKNEMPFKELIVVDQMNEENANLTNTPNQNIFKLLELDKDSSYESLVLKFRNEFQNGKLKNL